MSVEKWRSPIFEKKIIWPKNGPIRAKKGPERGFRPFSCSKCISFPRFCWSWLGVMILNGYLMVVEVLKKNFLALWWAWLGPKRGQNEVLGYFLSQNALVFANVAYRGRELWYLVGCSSRSAEKIFLALKWVQDQWWQVGPLKGIWSLKGTFELEGQKNGPFFTQKVPFLMNWSVF